MLEIAIRFVVAMVRKFMLSCTEVHTLVLRKEVTNYFRLELDEPAPCYNTSVIPT
jgi:hypothetical protein